MHDPINVKFIFIESLKCAFHLVFLEASVRGLFMCVFLDMDFYIVDAVCLFNT